MTSVDDVHIIDLHPGDTGLVRQVAAILVAGFKVHWPSAWPDMASALEEVRESFAPDRISRVAKGRDGRALGWIGGIPEYDGLVWELHPLVVAPEHQVKGVGRALVADFERQVKARGALTIMLGSDDVDGMTTLFGVDLYDDLPGQIARIKNLKGHPYGFYQKLGFVISGVVPDANGPGKPDILMCKRVGS